MAQCQQCGAELPETAQFCPACGLRAPHPAQAGPGVPPPKWGGRRVVLGFLGLVIALGLIFVVAVIYFIRHTTIVSSSKNGGRVEAPFGVVTSNNDPAQLARSLGLDLFPGAIGEKGTQAEIAPNVITAMEFRTPAPPRTVIEFYHVRYPDATVKIQKPSYLLVQLNPRDTLTIKATPEKDATQIEINDIAH